MVSTIQRKSSKVKIAYETVGNSSAEPLLFLHGLGAGRAQTTSALTDLKDHLVIAPDMLGHGDSISEDPADVQSFDQFADDSIAILDAMGIEKANVGGLSMGSGISLNIALRYPERVKKLVLLRPSWLNEKRPQHLSLVAHVGLWIEEHGVKVAQRLLHKNAEYQELLARVPKVALSIDGLFGRPMHFSHTAVLYRMWEDSPFSSLDSLASVSNTSLVLHTTRDDLHPIPVAEAVTSSLANCDSMSLSPRYDDPVNYGIELNQAIVKFLA